MLNAQKIAKKIAFLRSRSLNFAIAIIPRSLDQMVIVDRDLDLVGKKQSDRRSLIPCIPLYQTVLFKNLLVFYA